MEQFHVTQERVKATLVYDGAIDGEPEISVAGPAGATMTQDPAVYEAPGVAPPEFPNGRTTAVVHHASTDTGTVSVVVVTMADKPGTAVKEELTGTYEFEWIPAGAAKATNLSASLESESA